MPKQPLAEVFGFPIDNMTPEAIRYRKNRLCPFGNIVPNCTKDKAEDPLGVCSILDKNNEAVITCPVRFREDWLVATDAATFFFGDDAKWTSLAEVRLQDRNGRSAGNIDIVLIAYDDAGRITDYGAVEVQAVYISGNVRTPFQAYMGNPAERGQMDWSRQPLYPRPDYLSSSRKRLAPQLLFKGSILHAWKRKTAVALNRGFFQTLPELEEVEEVDADIAWFIYDLVLDKNTNRRSLTSDRVVYTKFETSLIKITQPDIGEESNFLLQLQTQLDKKLGNAPVNQLPPPPF